MHGQMCGDGLVGRVKGGIAGDGGGGDPDLQVVDRDPFAKARAQQEGRPVTDDRCETGRQQRRQRRLSGQAERGFGAGGKRDIGVEMGQPASRGGQPAMPVRQLSVAIDRQGQRQAIGPSEPAVGQDPGRLVRAQPQLQRRVGAGQRHLQCDIAGKAVGAVKVEDGTRRLAFDRGIAGDRGDDAFAQHRRRQFEAGDRQPVDGQSDRQLRQVNRSGWRRGARWRSRHIDLGHCQRSDMHFPGEQIGRREIEGDIAQGKPNAGAVADFDARGRHPERHSPAQPLDRQGKPGAACGARDNPGQPILPGSGLQQSEHADREQDRAGDGECEPAGNSAHQNASPRLT